MAKNCKTVDKGPKARAKGAGRPATRKRLPRGGRIRLRALAAQGMAIGQAAEALRLRSEDLAEILAGKPTIKRVWDRGQFLFQLTVVAETTSDVDAAAELGMTAEEFAELLGSDAEAADIWRHAKMRARRTAYSHLQAAAAGGSVTAVRELLKILAEPGGAVGGPVQFEAMTVSDAATAMGVSRKTLYEWFEKGCPRNGDKTANLPAAIRWLRAQASAKATGEETHELRYRQARAERMEMDVAATRGQLLDRRAVMSHVLAILQIVRGLRDMMPVTWAEILEGQTASAIRQRVEGDFDQALGAMLGQRLDMNLPPEAQLLWDKLARLIVRTPTKVPGGVGAKA